MAALGSPYRAALSQAILKLQETNRLLILKKRWWQEKRGGGACKVSFAYNLTNYILTSILETEELNIS